MRRGIMSFVAGVALVSCGGLVEGDPGAAGGGRPRADGGAVSPVADASAGGATPKAPPPGPPSPVLRCTFSDGSFSIGSAADADHVELIVRAVDAQVLVHVSNGVTLRRYRLATDSPCLLERDLTFGDKGELNVRGHFAMDEAGNVWSSINARVRRALPQPSFRCTMDPTYLDEDGTALSEAGPLFLDEGGATGWALGGPPGKLGRLTLGATACSVDLIDSPFAFALRSNTPRDAEGRLHVVDAPAPGMIGIFTVAGAPVGAYPGKTGPAGLDPIDITRCAGGVCVLGEGPGAQALTYFDDDGSPRATFPTIKGLRARRVAAAARGPVFLAGASDPMLEPERVVVQIAPSPPP